MDHTARDRAIVDAYQSGLSLRAIARRFTLSHERVRQVLQEQGVASRTRSDAVKLSKTAS